MTKPVDINDIRQITADAIAEMELLRQATIDLEFRTTINPGITAAASNGRSYAEFQVEREDMLDDLIDILKENGYDVELDGHDHITKLTVYWN